MRLGVLCPGEVVQVHGVNCHLNILKIIGELLLIIQLINTNIPVDISEEIINLKQQDDDIVTQTDESRLVSPSGSYDCDNDVLLL